MNEFCPGLFILFKSDPVLTDFFDTVNRGTQTAADNWLLHLVEFFNYHAPNMLVKVAEVLVPARLEFYVPRC